MSGQVHDIVNDYVRLLDRGDVAAANRLRCEPMRVSPQEEGSFASRVQDIKTDLGGELTVRRLKFIESPRYAVELYLKGATEPVTLSLSREPTGVSLCGQRIDTSSAVLRELNVQPQEDYKTSASPRAIAEIVPIEGYNGTGLVVPPLGPLRGDPAVQSHWFQEWIGQSGEPAVGIAAIQFRDSTSAIGGQLAVETNIAVNAVKAIEVSHPASRAMRHLASVITFIQPPGAGPLRDLATLRYGSVVVVLTVTPVDESSDSLLPEIVDTLNASIARTDTGGVRA